MQTILVVESDRFSRAATLSALNTAGYNTLEADSFAGGVHSLRKLIPNAAIVDYELNDGSGLDLFAQIQQNELKQRIPTIILTPNWNDSSRVSALESGVDDVMSKPIALNELVLRLSKMIKTDETKTATQFNISSRGINLDMQSLQVTIGGQNTDLSLSEFRLLYHFMRNPNKAFSRNELRLLTKGDEAKLDERSIDVYVMRLRKSLQKRGYQDLIQTVRGIGYRFNA
jgi:two-component system phosphate regulon response regulator PhoB